MAEHAYRLQDEIMRQIALHCPARAAEMDKKRQELWDSYQAYLRKT